MASVKNRAKALKNASTKKGRGNTKKSLTGTKCAAEKNAANDIEPNIVMKRPSDVKMLSTEEKVQLLLQNGHLLKDKFVKSTENGRGWKNDTAAKDNLITKNGRIKKKSKDNMKLFNNILKSELMIDDRQKKTDRVNNNINDIELNSHNKAVNLASKAEASNKTKTVAKIKSVRRGRPCGKVDKSNLIDKSKLREKSKMKRITLNNDAVLALCMFQCDHCNKTFTSKASIRRHMLVHLKLKLHNCPHCTRKFQLRLNLHRHIKRQHADVDDTSELFICHICDKPFLLQENLSLHMTSHSSNENLFKCLYCEKKFSHQSLLSDHEKQHLVTGRYQCTICNTSYDCRNSLSMHVKSHLKIKDFICQYCGKEFLRLNSMKRHVQICHGGHRIQCPICKKSLKGHLTEHMRTHEKRRPHECPDCGQRFTQSTQLNVHRRSHTGARPYPCRICSQPFSHSNALMLHIRRHTGEKPFSCAMCPISFSQLPHMKAHMRKIHGKENPYKCTKCGQFFKLKAQLENHAKNCSVGDKELSFEEKIEASVKYEEIEVESVMSLSRMRFLLALLLTMIASKQKLKYLGFNKRLIDDLLVESLEAMGQTPCKDVTVEPLKRLKTNIELLLNSTIPDHQMEKFRNENKTTEELLEILTDEKKND